MLLKRAADTVHLMKIWSTSPRSYKRALLIVLPILGTTLTACGSTEKADYSAFCTLATQMQAASADGAHSQNPAAITDPKNMEASWAKITTVASKMTAGSPEAIRPDVTTMVDSIVAMDKIFKANQYDLLSMSKSPEVREQLAAISSDTKVSQASTRFSSFMTKNCPTPK